MSATKNAAQAYATALANALKTMSPGTAEFIRTKKELAVMRRDHGCN
ncbi:hypothetical protein KJ682_17190 [bacterium]|nr:hypothetical protein [bacterium]